MPEKGLFESPYYAKQMFKHINVKLGRFSTKNITDGQFGPLVGGITCGHFKQGEGTVQLREGSMTPLISIPTQ